MVTIVQLDEIFENIKPLSFGRRLIFQKYCKYLVEDKRIEQCYVDKYTSEEFLYEDYSKEYKTFKTSKDKFNELMDKLQENALKERVWGAVEELEEQRKFENTLRDEKFKRDIIKMEQLKIKGEEISTWFANFTTNIVFMYATYKFVKSFL